MRGTHQHIVARFSGTFHDGFILHKESDLIVHQTVANIDWNAIPTTWWTWQHSRTAAVVHVVFDGGDCIWKQLLELATDKTRQE
jgi:hypothetical protein